MTDRERISRLEALLARVKARTDEPRPELSPENGNGENANGTHAEADEIYEEAELIEEPTDDVAAAAVGDQDFSDDSRLDSQPELNAAPRVDSVFPVESSTLQALPPPPPNSSNNAFVAPDSSPIADPISQPVVKHDAPALPNSSPASLEEAFEQYEMVSEVVELTPDAEDDSVRPSIPAPIMSDEMFDDRREPVSHGESQLHVATPTEEFQSQQRLVVAPSTRPVSGVDAGELEVLGEADLGSDEVMDVETDDLLARTSEVEVQSSRPTRQAEEMIATILSTGLDAPPENANRPVLELQDEDELEEPPPSSRRPVSHEEVHEQELTFENDPLPSPPLTPPPESGPQVALPDLSSTSLSAAFEADFSGVRKDSLDEPMVLRAPLADNSGVAVVVAPSAPRAAATFGELIDIALSI